MTDTEPLGSKPMSLEKLRYLGHASTYKHVHYISTGKNRSKQIESINLDTHIAHLLRQNIMRGLEAEILSN